MLNVLITVHTIISIFLAKNILSCNLHCRWFIGARHESRQHSCMTRNILPFPFYFFNGAYNAVAVGRFFFAHQSGIVLSINQIIRSFNLIVSQQLSQRNFDFTKEPKEIGKKKERGKIITDTLASPR